MPAYPSRDNCHIWNSNLLATGEENRITKPECISEIARATGAGKIFLFNFISGVQLLPQATGTVFASLSLASCSTHLEGKLLSSFYNSRNTRNPYSESCWVGFDQILFREKSLVVHQLHGVVLDVLQGPDVGGLFGRGWSWFGKG